MKLPGLLVTPAKSRVRVGLGAAVILVLVALGIAVLVSILGPHGVTQSLGPDAVASVSPGGAESAAGGTSRPGSSTGAGNKSSSAIFVHVVGAVMRPGLFELRDGDRVVDAVAAAGGFTETADKSQVNLARFVSDGEQLAVPVVGEAQPAPGAAGIAGGKVNLNTADLAALETLPRVGPAMAQRIIDWRTTNGRFSAVEDLMSVTGVGDKTFEQLKNLVTI
ncbi:MAG: helix-hairpin-helix domain-containing protein [Lacisediminihabitans sp.]